MVLGRVRLGRGPPHTAGLPHAVQSERRSAPSHPEAKAPVGQLTKYDTGLQARGSLTVWFTPEAVEAWKPEPRPGRGRQPSYLALATVIALTLRAVFRLALRQTEGLIASIFQLFGPDLPVPDRKHPELSGRGARSTAAKSGEYAGAPVGGQHGVEALWFG
ncbi:transposase [Belnapia arida]